MIIRVVFTKCTEKILAIKFLRAIGKMGLKEAKDLVDAIDVNRNLNQRAELTGEYRLNVDPAKALAGLLPQLNQSTTPGVTNLGCALPKGMNLYVEQLEIIDCRGN